MKIRDLVYPYIEYSSEGGKCYFDFLFIYSSIFYLLLLLNFLSIKTPFKQFAVPGNNKYAVSFYDYRFDELNIMQAIAVLVSIYQLFNVPFPYNCCATLQLIRYYICNLKIEDSKAVHTTKQRDKGTGHVSRFSKFLIELRNSSERNEMPSKKVRKH